MRISFVFPNICEIRQRGGLIERWILAKKAGCSYIEVPADFIKNKTEILRTGLKIGSFLTRDAIELLYKKDKPLEEIRYILHTEPSLTRVVDGTIFQPLLKWYSKEWVKKFVEMLLLIAKFFNKSPDIIEIHPGHKENSYKDIISSAEFILNEFENEFEERPYILIENRTGQIISNGREISLFWELFIKEKPELKKEVGIVLDVQQLYTSTKNKFLRELNVIPHDCLKGFHIHYKHKAPTRNDKIPWNNVFKKITEIETKTNIIINPEVHHKHDVRKTIDFIKDGLKSFSKNLLFT